MSSETNPVEQINTAMNDAIVAQEAGNYALAERRARSAWMMVASLPDSELALERLRWKPDSIRLIVDELSRLAKAHGQSTAPGGSDLFRPIEVEYTRG